MGDFKLDRRDCTAVFKSLQSSNEGRGGWDVVVVVVVDRVASRLASDIPNDDQQDANAIQRIFHWLSRFFGRNSLVSAEVALRNLHLIAPRYCQNDIRYLSLSLSLSLLLCVACWYTVWISV
jgi:hypothetical protein